MPLNFIMHKIKKYQLNFNKASYNYFTGVYENNDGKFPSYMEARVLDMESDNVVN